MYNDNLSQNKKDKNNMKKLPKQQLGKDQTPVGYVAVSTVLVGHPQKRYCSKKPCKCSLFNNLKKNTETSVVLQVKPLVVRMYFMISEKVA